MGSNDADQVPSLSNAFFAIGSYDWTDVLPSTEHVDHFRNADFGSTAMGPLADWGPALRLYVTMLFANSRATALYWGPHRICIYNEQQAELVGAAHPKLMGQTFDEGFPGLSESIGPILDRATSTSQTVNVDNIQLFPNRSGYPEETYFIGQFIPLRGDSGHVEGIFNTVYENTFQVIYDRRRRVMDQLALIPSHTIDETLASVIEALRSNPNDIPMAMIYSFDDLDTYQDINLCLRGSIGVPDDALCAPRIAKLQRSTLGLVPYFRQAQQNGATIVLSESDGSLQEVEHLFNKVSWRGFGEASRQIMIVPLSSGKKLLGFYVQGTNPRRPYDSNVEAAVISTTTQIVAKWMSSMSTEEAAKREDMLQRRLTDRERRLRVMAQSAPMGMCSIDSDRAIERANDQFYDIMGLQRSSADLISAIAPQHRQGALQNFDALRDGNQRIVCEYKLTRKWSPSHGDEQLEREVAAWALAVCFSMFEDGNRSTIMYVTDISQQKWAAAVESRHANAAELARRQQENFIDTISHEMRNPLTAIIHLAESIAKSHDNLNGSDASYETCKRIVDSNIEAAKIILTCTAHQKRIIDDVLILSGLESHMLSITPFATQLDNVVANTVKMFAGELAMSDIQIETTKDPSCNAHNVHYISCDASRLMQVLINLINNAVKFTAKRPKRAITITYGASIQRPPRLDTHFGQLEWLATNADTRNATAWDTDGGEALYVYFCIRDTGTGVPSTEIDNLFKRFSQANSKTHVSYGGSGLGLFISKELAEKMGGEIGVATQHGEGSAFGFYIETRHIQAPQIAPGPHTHGADIQPNGGAPEEADQAEHAVRVDLMTNHVSDKTNQRAVKDGSSTLKTASNGENVNMLLVEDNLVNQKIFAKNLQRAGFNVTVANHGQEALEILEANGHWSTGNEHASDGTHIDAILMDWEMPIMDGLQCCRHIREKERAEPKTNRLPIVAITANVRPEQIDEAWKAGMDEVLLKPFAAKDLVHKIRKVMVHHSDK